MCQPGRPGPHGRRPRGLAGLRVLPHHEVERIVLELVDLHARARARFVDASSRERAVGRELAHRVHDVAVLRPVGVALVDERLRHRDDLGDVLGGARLRIGRLQAEQRAVLVHGGDEAARERPPVLAVLRRALDDLVVDVRDVAHVGDGIAARAQIALHQIEHGEHARVAQVDVVVHGDAADVHAHFVAAQRLELGLLAGERVMYLEHGIRAGAAPSPGA